MTRWYTCPGCDECSTGFMFNPDTDMPDSAYVEFTDMIQDRLMDEADL